VIQSSGLTMSSTVSSSVLSLQPSCLSVDSCVRVYLSLPFHREKTPLSNSYFENHREIGLCYIPPCVEWMKSTVGLFVVLSPSLSSLLSPPRCSCLCRVCVFQIHHTSAESLAATISRQLSTFLIYKRVVRVFYSLLFSFSFQ